MKRSDTLADLMLKSITLLTLALPLSARADGGVSGKVTYPGHSSKEVVHMDADQTCMSMHPGGFEYKSIAVNSNGGLANVFIYVKKGLEGKKFPVPKETKVVLDQKGCWYHPRVFGIMVGQTLNVQNSDPLLHNVNAEPEFNAPMPPGTPDLIRVFRESRVMFPIHCNIHAWMHGFVGVVTNPYYAVSSENGSYSIKDLPPGHYTLQAWQEKLGTISKEVDVPASGLVLNFRFDQGGGGKAEVGGASSSVAEASSRPSHHAHKARKTVAMGETHHASHHHGNKKVLFLTTPDGNKTLKCKVLSNNGDGKVSLDCSVLENQ